MLKTTAAALILLIPSLTQAFEIDSGISGTWYDPDHSGHGFAIEVLDQDSILVYWYFYTPDGDSAFALGVGTYQGDTATVALNYPHGMMFGAFAPAPTLYPWGTVTITFSSCDSGFIEYSSNLISEGGDPFGSGAFPIVRLAYLQDLECPADSQTGPPIGGGAQVVIESEISGSFDGWDGDTVVELANGQVWQQNDFHIELGNELFPYVVVYKSIVTWKMWVEGFRKPVEVVRIR